MSSFWKKKAFYLIFIQNRGRYDGNSVQQTYIYIYWFTHTYIYCICMHGNQNISKMRLVVTDRQTEDYQCVIPIVNPHYAFRTSASYKNGKVTSSNISKAALNATLVFCLTHILYFYTSMLHMAINKHGCPAETVSLCALLCHTSVLDVNFWSF
jgi:hypothetical protein